MIEKEISVLRNFAKPHRSLGYDDLSKIVNDSYARTNDIRETVKETRLSFSEVWEMTGNKDHFDFVDTDED